MATIPLLSGSEKLFW